MGHPEQTRHAWLASAIAGTLLALSLAVFGPELARRAVGSSESAVARPDGPRPEERGGEPGLADLALIDSVSTRLGSEGGRLDAPGGHGRVSLPAGALARETEIGITRYAVDHPDAADTFAIDLQPDGLTLARPARLELPIPPGLEPDDVEISVFDPRRERWTREPIQDFDAAAGVAVARLSHFSLRRIRIRPGLDLAYDPDRARGTFYMEADAGNTFERYVEGRWKAYRHGAPGYRELMQLHRSGRHALILSGRLRAVTGARPRPEIFRNHRRTVAMPAGLPEARSGWVRLSRLDGSGRPTGPRVIARVNDYGPGPAARRAGVTVDMTRATMEALGLVWERDFGLAGENGNLAWIRYTPDGSDTPLRHVPIRLEAYRARTGDAASCRLW